MFLDQKIEIILVTELSSENKFWPYGVKIERTFFFRLRVRSFQHVPVFITVLNTTARKMQSKTYINEDNCTARGFGASPDMAIKTLTPNPIDI